MRVAEIRRVSLLVAGILIASCSHPRRAAPAPEPLVRTITLRNSSRDRIQVYLVGQKEHWLLGRLEPLETSRLRLPESSFTDTDEAVVIAVLPGWSRSLAPRADRRAVLSLLEHRGDLAGKEWIFVNGALQGPGQGR
jgi:hypothetical protein